MKHTVTVTVTVEVDASRDETLVYVEDAVVGWGGGLRPCSPFYALTSNDVTVQPVRRASSVFRSENAAERIECLHDMLKDSRSYIIDAFLLGASEFRRSLTTRLDTDQEQEAYDRGREWAHAATEREFEDGGEEVGS